MIECLLLLAAARPAPLAPQVSARTRKGAAAEGSGSLHLVVGAGLEYQRDKEEKVFEYPFTLEYNFSDAFKLIAESSFVTIHPRDEEDPNLNGIGDFETFIEAEFLSERRNRPALTLEAGIKWPTADAPDIGTGKRDYTVGMIASKELEDLDVDLGAIYTWVGSTPEESLNNVLELSLAAEWQFTDAWSLIAEGLYSLGGDAVFRGHGGGIGGGAGGLSSGDNGNGFEFAGGFAEQISDHLKLEQGLAIQSDGTLQLILYAEWDFGGGE